MLLHLSLGNGVEVVICIRGCGALLTVISTLVNFPMV